MSAPELPDVPAGDIMTPAQPALDAMMEGVTAGPWVAEHDDDTGMPRVYTYTGGGPVSLIACVGNVFLRDNAPVENEANARFIAAARELVPALAAEVRAQRETIAGLDARVEALTGALHAAPNPSKFGAGIAEYQRLAEALQDWRQDHVCPALSKGDTP
jgi:hypothetical protein